MVWLCDGQFSCVIVMSTTTLVLCKIYISSFIVTDTRSLPHFCFGISFRRNVTNHSPHLRMNRADARFRAIHALLL